MHFANANLAIYNRDNIKQFGPVFSFYIQLWKLFFRNNFEKILMKSRNYSSRFTHLIQSNAHFDRTYLPKSDS